jgi:hypothetical protein
MSKKIIWMLLVWLLILVLSVGTIQADTGDGFSAEIADLIIEKTVDFNGDGIYTDSESNYPGNIASWNVTVTSAAQAANITSINVTDTNGHSFGAPFSLLPGESKTFIYTTIVSVDTVNIAYAQGMLQGIPIPFPDPCQDDAEALVLPVVGTEAQAINHTDILIPWVVTLFIIVLAFGIFKVRRQASHD